MNRITRSISTVCLMMLVTTVGLRAGEIQKAAAAGDLNKVRALLEADPMLLESRDDNGLTPLHSACGTKQVAVANFLLDKGANVNARDNEGMTPLHFASRGPALDFDLIQRLIAKGADVNAQLDRGFTSLHWVAISDDLKVAKLLIDHGANLNAYDKVGYGTVLQTAINFGRKDEMAMLLVESGAKLNQKFSFGNSELHLAAMKGYADLARVLVRHGADVHAVNENGRTALYYAAKHGYRSVADALIAAGAKESAIIEANYGKAPQLTTTLKEGEAYLWYLGGLVGGGYAVKTKGHLLLFDKSEIDESLEAGLSNGHLNPNELAGQKITVLITKPADLINESNFFELEKRIPGVDFVIGFKPTASSAGNRDIPPYRLAAPNTSFSVGDIQVHAIPATGRNSYRGADAGGLGYLVEADGVKIFHAGFHSSGNEASQVERFRKEIDFLKPFGPIDVAILSVSGHVNAAYQPYLYLLDQLSPKAVYLMGSDMTEEYPKCAEVLRARNIPVAYPEGGRATGERFHFVRGQAPAKSLPASTGNAVPRSSGFNIKYPGTRLPGLTPEVFAHDLVARNGSSTFNISFSLDGTMIVFRCSRDNTQETLVSEFKEGRWTEPQVSPLFPEVPDFTSSGKAYYATREGMFVMEKTASGWSPARPLIAIQNGGPRPTVADNGNIYAPIIDSLHRERGLDIYVLKLKDGVYQAPERLPATVNSSEMEEHLFVAPDESYLLFDSDRAGGQGKTDLYISFRQPDGSWSQARNLGASINSPGFDYNSRVSPDGKYLFYFSGTDGQLHWLDFQALVKELNAGR